MTDILKHRSPLAILEDQPFLLTYCGAWLIFVGCVCLLVSGIFLNRHTDESIWLSAAASLTVTIGASLYALTSFVNQQLLVCAGANLLFLGLVLFTSSVIWEGHDIRNDKHNAYPDQFHDNDEIRARISTCASGLIMIATGFFMFNGYQRWRKPHFGPQNYNAFGAAAFGSGAFCYLLFEIKHTSGALEDDDTYDPHPESSVFGTFLLVVGALLLLLAVSRLQYAIDQRVLSDYPHVVVLNVSTKGTFLLVVFAGIAFLGGGLVIVGRLLVSDDDRVKVMTTAFALVAFASISEYVICSCCAVFTISSEVRRSVHRFKSGLALQALAFSLYAISMGIRLVLLDDTGNNGGSGKHGDTQRRTYPDDLSTTAAAISFISFILLLYIATNYTSLTNQALSPGNFGALSKILGLGGSLCIFLFCLRRSISNDERDDEHKAVAFSGTETFGYMMWTTSLLFDFMFFNVALDFRLIRHKEDLTLRALLGKFWVSSGSETEENKTSPPQVSNLRTHSERFVEAFNENEKEVYSGVDAELDSVEADHLLSTDVVVIGCGPVGLTLCNELGQRGVHVIAVEKRATVIPDSRFFYLSSASMEGLKRSGTGDLILNRAIPQNFGLGAVFTTGLTQEDASLVASVTDPPRAQVENLGASEKLDTFTSSFVSRWAEQQGQRCMQSIQEECGKDIAETNENITLLYGHEAIAMDATSDEVVLKVKRIASEEALEQANEYYYLKCKYLVGCDGPGSFVAKTMKVKYDGFANLGVTRTLLFKAPGLREIITVSCCSTRSRSWFLCFERL